MEQEKKRLRPSERDEQSKSVSANRGKIWLLQRDDLERLERLPNHTWLLTRNGDRIQWGNKFEHIDNLTVLADQYTLYGLPCSSWSIEEAWKHLRCNARERKLAQWTVGATSYKRGLMMVDVPFFEDEGEDFSCQREAGDMCVIL
jgi:hypothetical protein